MPWIILTEECHTLHSFPASSFSLKEVFRQQSVWDNGRVAVCQCLEKGRQTESSIWRPRHTATGCRNLNARGAVHSCKG